MTIFIIGLVVFFGAHVFAALFRGARAGLIDRFGAGRYKGLYSAVSLAGFVLIIVGWRGADTSLLYAPPPFMRHIAYLLMAIAMVLIVAAYAPAGRIAAAVKHPMLAAVKIWAFAHLLVNGEVRSVVLFGAFLAFAVADRIAVKRRDTPARAAGGAANDAVAVIVGLGAYAVVLFYLHRYIAGVPLF